MVDLQAGFISFLLLFYLKLLHKYYNIKQKLDTQTYTHTHK